MRATGSLRRKCALPRVAEARAFAHQAVRPEWHAVREAGPDSARAARRNVEAMRDECGARRDAGRGVAPSARSAAEQGAAGGGGVVGERCLARGEPVGGQFGHRLMHQLMHLKF